MQEDGNQKRNGGASSANAGSEGPVKVLERIGEAWQAENFAAKCVKLWEGQSLKKEDGWICGEGERGNWIKED